MEVGDIYVIDAETTGPDIFENDLLYVHISPLADKRKSLDLYVRYPKLELKWSSVGRRYFNKEYGETWEKKAVLPETGLKQLHTFFDQEVGPSEVVLAGHNVAFDYYFLKKLAFRAQGRLPDVISHRLLDVHSCLLLLHLKGKIPTGALKSLGSLDYFGVQGHRKHRHSAKSDVDNVKVVLHELLKLY